MTTDTRPRQRPTAPATLRPPKAWRSTITTKGIVDALEAVERVDAERRAARVALDEAERALELAGVQDRDELAAAISNGTKRPASDRHSSKAAEALAGARRLHEASREAFATTTRNAVVVIREHSAKALTAIGTDLEKQAGVVAKAIASLDVELRNLADLRDARAFLQSEGRRPSFAHPAAGEWRDGRKALEHLVADPQADDDEETTA